MQVFISHSSKDADVAEKICNFIEEKGEKCFLAPRDIRSGREYAEEIIDGIEQSGAMVLLMSEDANHSPHVLREVERAVSKSIPILVYKLEDVNLTKSMEYFLMTHQWSEAKIPEDYSKIWEFISAMNAEAESAEEVPQRGAGLQSKEKNSIMLIAVVTVLVVVAIGLVAATKNGVLFGDGAGDKQEATVPVTYEVGDTVTFGNYLNEAIEWRVLKLSEDGNAAVLVAKNILTMKAFDAAESGAYNQDGDADYWSQVSLADTDLELQRKVRGNNDWSASNIRTWLNSADEVVTYADQPPMASAMSEKRNGYHNEAGFLYGFTEEELAAILPTENVTRGNALTEGTVTTEDKVYLLSVEELAWFEEAGISKLAVPTQAALEQDVSEWYEVHLEELGTKEYIWWLRDPVAGTTSQCHMVGNGYTEENIQKANVGLEGYGVRPAITVDLCAECFGENVK